MAKPYFWMQRRRLVKCGNERNDPSHQDISAGNHSPGLGELHGRWRSRDSRVNNDGLRPEISVHRLQKQKPLSIEDVPALKFSLEREDGLISAPGNLGEP